MTEFTPFPSETKTAVWFRNRNKRTKAIATSSVLVEKTGCLKERERAFGLRFERKKETSRKRIDDARIKLAFKKPKPQEAARRKNVCKTNPARNENAKRLDMDERKPNSRDKLHPKAKEEKRKSKASINSITFLL